MGVDIDNGICLLRSELSAIKVGFLPIVLRKRTHKANERRLAYAIGPVRRTRHKEKTATNRPCALGHPLDVSQTFEK